MGLKESIQSGERILAVYGLGNVGGPVAAVWLRQGARVIGVDISDRLLAEIKDGTSHSKEALVPEILAESLESGKLDLTSDGVDASRRSHIKFVAVPVDMKDDKIQLDFLLSAVTSISHGLKRNDAVIICPTLPPGTTDTTVRDILEQNSGLRAERDFVLVYSPERIYEGRAVQDIEENYPAIISGFGERSLAFADELFCMIAKRGTMRMSSMRNAEAEKLFEGVYRDVNIALANELATYCESAGVDFWDARRGANSQPFCDLHSPGTGVGGLCIPVYPRFVLEASSRLGKSMRVVEHSRMVNDDMPKKCVNDALELLKTHGTDPRGCKVAVLGLGFRGEVSDTRLSPTYAVVDEFLNAGCMVHVHDPFVHEDATLPDGIVLDGDLDNTVRGAGLVFISSDHDMYRTLTEESLRAAGGPMLVFDGRNILDRTKFATSSVVTVGTRPGADGRADLP